MVLSDVSIKRPVFATVLSLLIVVFGVAALLGLPVREYPDIDPPVVSVATDYTGAAADYEYDLLTEYFYVRTTTYIRLTTLQLTTTYGVRPTT